MKRLTQVLTYLRFLRSEDAVRIAYRLETGGMIPITGMSCPKCLAAMRYSVGGDERHDHCMACGDQRTTSIDVGS